jgi:hypothetical protein
MGVRKGIAKCPERILDEWSLALIGNASGRTLRVKETLLIASDRFHSRWTSSSRSTNQEQQMNERQWNRNTLLAKPSLSGQFKTLKPGSQMLG